MENFTRSLSKSLSRSVSTSVDRNKVWRTRANADFDDGRSINTVHLGEDSHGGFWKIKNIFNFNNSRKHKKDTSKAHQKIASSSDEFQSRLLSEIYKNMSSTHELSSCL
ncbi:hypothetical protein Hanom_Chr15g01372951 [Helianthus anomalus]